MLQIKYQSMKETLTFLQQLQFGELLKLSLYLAGLWI